MKKSIWNLMEIGEERNGTRDNGENADSEAVMEKEVKLDISRFLPTHAMVQLRGIIKRIFYYNIRED